MARYFLDTNILVYADDLDAPAKQAVALGLIEQGLTDGSAVLSTQVLQEFYVAATRKLGVPLEVARRKVELLAGLEVVPVGTDLILGAVDLQRLHGFSFWDALILQAALQANCTICYSEDLQHGRKLGGLVILNPFLPLA